MVDDGQKSKFQRRLSEMPQPSTTHPSILILDETLQRLPWESMPCLDGRPIYRLPSFVRELINQFIFISMFLQTMLSRRLRLTTLNSSLSFYILNPSNDLPQTQVFLSGRFCHLLSFRSESLGKRIQKANRLERHHWNASFQGTISKRIIFL
jgi:hypothetical protein